MTIGQNLASPSQVENSYNTEDVNENRDAGQGRVPVCSMQQNDHHDHHDHTGDMDWQLWCRELQRSGAVARRRSGAVAQWRSGAVAQWRSGTATMLSNRSSES